MPTKNTLQNGPLDRTTDKFQELFENLHLEQKKKEFQVMLYLCDGPEMRDAYLSIVRSLFVEAEGPLVTEQTEAVKKAITLLKQFNCVGTLDNETVNEAWV